MTSHIIDLVRFSDLEAIALLMGWEKKYFPLGEYHYYVLKEEDKTLCFRRTNYENFTMVWGAVAEVLVSNQNLTKQKLKELTGIDLCEVNQMKK